MLGQIGREMDDVVDGMMELNDRKAKDVFAFRTPLLIRKKTVTI